MDGLENLALLHESDSEETFADNFYRHHISPKLRKVGLYVKFDYTDDKRRIGFYSFSELSDELLQGFDLELTRLPKAKIWDEIVPNSLIKHLSNQHVDKRLHYLALENPTSTLWNVYFSEELIR